TVALSRLARGLAPVIAIAVLVISMGGTWRIAGASPPSIAAEVAQQAPPDEKPREKSDRELTGKININTASAEQLVLLPTIGPSKAERIVTWRKKNGGFKRIADILRVKGIGYKTFKRLEPF